MNYQAMYSLLIIILTVSFAPVITRNIRVIRFPAAEIIAGLILGVSGFNLIENSPVLNFLSSVGSIYLIFLAGLEIDFNTVLISSRCKSEREGSPIILAFGVFGLTVLLSFLIALGFTKIQIIKSSWLGCLVLSTTSLSIVPMLKEKGIINSMYGQTILISALIADFFSVLLTTVVVINLTHSDSHKLFPVILLLFASYLLYKLLKFFPEAPVISALARNPLSKTRGCLMLIFIMVVLSEYVGKEFILGAFMAGAIISFMTKKVDYGFVLKLESIGYSFFIPIFFIIMGARINLQEAAKTGNLKILLPVFVGALYLVKLLPALLFRIMFSWRQSISAGILLSSRFNLIIAVAALGVRFGAMSQKTYGVITISAVITCLASPLIFEKLSSRKNKVQSTE